MFYKVSELRQGTKVKFNKDHKCYEQFSCSNRIPSIDDKCPTCSMFHTNIQSSVFTIRFVDVDSFTLKERYGCTDSRIVGGRLNDTAFLTPYQWEDL